MSIFLSFDFTLFQAWQMCGEVRWGANPAVYTGSGHLPFFRTRQKWLRSLVQSSKSCKMFFFFLLRAKAAQPSAPLNLVTAPTFPKRVKPEDKSHKMLLRAAPGNSLGILVGWKLDVCGVLEFFLERHFNESSIQTLRIEAGFLLVLGLTANACTLLLLCRSISGSAALWRVGKQAAALCYSSTDTKEASGWEGFGVPGECSGGAVVYCLPICALSSQMSFLKVRRRTVAFGSEEILIQSRSFQIPLLQKYQNGWVF